MRKRYTRLTRLSQTDGTTLDQSRPTGPPPDPDLSLWIPRSWLDVPHWSTDQKAGFEPFRARPVDVARRAGTDSPRIPKA